MLADTYGVLCGPPVMYRFVVEEMRKKGITYDHIYMSFERHMKCGMGKCGHCQVGHQYVCIDGPRVQLLGSQEYPGVDVE